MKTNILIVLLLLTIPAWGGGLDDSGLRPPDVEFSVVKPYFSPTFGIDMTQNAGCISFECIEYVSLHRPPHNGFLVLSRLNIYSVTFRPMPGCWSRSNSLSLKTAC